MGHVSFINGTERVIVTQLVRSPGAYLMEPQGRDEAGLHRDLMPSRGSWLELEIDKKGIVYARIDRKRKLPITTLSVRFRTRTRRLASSSTRASNEAILKLFDNSIYIVNTIEKDTDHARRTRR